MIKNNLTRKEKGLTKMELRHRFLPWKLLRFLKVNKFTDKQIFNLSKKQGRIQKFWTEGALCRPPWLADEENFRFQIV